MVSQGNLKPAKRMQGNRKGEDPLASASKLHERESEEIMSNFLVPEGCGCTRNSAARAHLSKVVDRFALNSMHEHALYYEASLERLERATEEQVSGRQRRLLLPSLSGVFMRGARLDEQLPVDLFAQYSRVHHLDGSLASNKSVFNGAALITYKIDRLTGHSSTLKTLAGHWQLEFPYANESEIVTLDDATLTQLLQTRWAHV